ncbi:MAG: hypothetical protein ACK5Q5_10420 [Planctomycetaceae bacterium]
MANQKSELTVNDPADAAPRLASIRMFNTEGTSELFPIAIGLLAEMAETEPNNRVHEATVVPTLPMTVDGNLHKSNEVDMYAVSLAADQQLVVAIESRDPLGGPADMVAQLVSPDGFVVAQNDDYAGMDPLLTYQAGEAETVYVRLFAFPATPDSSIRFVGGDDYVYRMTLASGPFLSHVLTTELDSGTPGRQVPRGWNLTGNDVDLASTPGLHWLQTQRRIAGVATTSDAAADRLTETAVPDWSQAIVGTITQPGKVDRFRYTAKKGTTVIFEAKGPGIGSRLDPVLQLVDANGRSLKESDDIAKDNLDASLEWKVPEDMDCWVTVRDRFDHAGDDYLYQLTVSSKTPWIDLNVDADQFVLSRQSPLEVTVKVNRQHGDGRTLSIAVADLPQGVTCPAVTSEAKGETSKQVKLTLTAGAAPGFNGPIRVVGVVEGDNEPAATATASTRVPGLRTTSLWLTIQPPDATESKK